MDKKYKSVIINHLTEILGKQKMCNQDMNASDLDELLDVSSKQGVGATLFPIFNKNYIDKNLHSQTWGEWKSRFFNAALLNVMFMKQIKELLHLLEKENVLPIVLKGLALASLYQNPEFRIMCDLDILVRADDWEKAKGFLVKNGYVQTEDDDYNVLHVKYQKSNWITVELHRNLIHTDYLGNRYKERWYSHVWEHRRKVTLKDMEFYAMSAEDELIHQITHFAAHFVYLGTKLRHLFEMAMIIKSHEETLDWAYLIETLKTIGFFDFGCLLLSVCKKFFNIDISDSFLTVHEKTVDKFMDDLLNYFSYEKTKEDFNGWVHVVSRIKPEFHYLLFQPLIWMLVARAQYKTHGLKLPFILINSIRNIKAANKKIKVIRHFGLSGM